MLTGENGILTQANNAKEATEKASVIEQAQIDILEKQTENGGADLTTSDLKEILNKYFEGVPEKLPEDLRELELKSKEEYGGQMIKVSEIYSGTLEQEKEGVPETESYVGYYADVDGDKVADGIIFVDLADTEHTSGRWNNDIEGWSDYEYTPVTENLKKYEICSESYSGFNGKWERPVLTEIKGSGTNDRFYVMALEDINPGTRYCWYDAAYGKLDKIVSETTNDFGAGKENTEYVKAKFDLGEAEGGWGKQNDNGTYADMWGVEEVKDKIKEGWFVPSKSEWAAFGDFTFTKLGVKTSNYSTYGLNDWYWSSSQDGANYAYSAGFDDGYMGSTNVLSDGCVRMCATF